MKKNFNDQLTENTLKRFLFFFMTIVISSFSNSAKAQDPGFSQFYANPINMNPAFAGTSIYQRVVTNYRNQWPNQGNTFVTYNFTYDSYLKSMKCGLGFQLLYDKELNGVINSANSSVFYSYHVKAGDELFFTGGLQVGVIYKEFNTSNLIFPGMIDQGTGEIIGQYPLPVEDGNKLVPDISFGIAAQNKNAYFGLAVHHLSQPSLSIIDGDHLGKLPMKITVHAGSMLHKYHRMLMSKEFTLSPNMIYQQQGSFKQLNFGVYIIERSITFGAWYRNNLSLRPDAAIAMIGYTEEKFRFGYSYDYTLSNIGAYSHGSHELSVAFFFGSERKDMYNETMRIPGM